MLRIACPYCGVRDESEFGFGGESSSARPGPDVSDAEWCRYLFFRANVQGENQEAWCHAFGCGQWLVVTRHTVTHEIEVVSPMGEGKKQNTPAEDSLKPWSLK